MRAEERRAGGEGGFRWPPYPDERIYYCDGCAGLDQPETAV